MHLKQQGTAYHIAFRELFITEDTRVRKCFDIQSHRQCLFTKQFSERLPLHIKLNASVYSKTPFMPNTAMSNHALYCIFWIYPLRCHVFRTLYIKLAPAYYGIYRAFLLMANVLSRRRANNFAVTEYKRFKKSFWLRYKEAILVWWEQNKPMDELHA